MHDLLPLAQTEAMQRHLVPRIGQVQVLLGRRLVLENVSSSVQFAANEMAEHEFVAEPARCSDGLLLLDVNKVHVSSVNHGFDARAYIDAMPAELDMARGIEARVAAEVADAEVADAEVALAEPAA